jgi:hypothetical protein
VVVDNASGDGSPEAIAERFPRVRLLAETHNHGFARAHDVAVPATRGDWLLLLNPDTVVLDGAIDKLMDFARRRPEAGIWGGRTVFGDGSLNPSSCWRRMSVWSLFCRLIGLTAVFPRSGLFNPEAYGGWPRDTEREVDIVTGCLLLIQRRTWDELGGFDRAYVMYGEEADLCLRARKMGYRPMITPKATIVHYGAASERVKADKTIRLMRAKLRLVGQHFGPLSRPVGRAFLIGWPLSRSLAAGTLAKITGGPRWREAAASWQEVWTRRREWLQGY